MQWYIFWVCKDKWLQALAWWVAGSTLQRKNIDLNYFNGDVISDAIEDFRLDFEDIIDGKGDLSKPKEFSHEKWTQWEDIIYN